MNEAAKRGEGTTEPGERLKKIPTYKSLEKPRSSKHR